MAPAKPFGILRGLLILAALLCLAGGITIAALEANQLSMSPSWNSPTPAAIVMIIAPLALGIFGTGILLGVAGILRLLTKVSAKPAHADDVRPSLERLEQSLRILNTTKGDAGTVVATPVLSTNGSNTSNLAPLLESIRDLTLMSDEQRKRFAIRHWNRRRELLTEMIERSVLVGDWPAAFARLDDLVLLLPEDAAVKELKERVEFEQVARLEEDLRVARSRFGHLISVAAWPQVESLAQDLKRKYPGKPEVTQFANDIDRARDAYERENMERLFHEISSATERRQWRTAIQKLGDFVRQYPGDPRAEALRLDLPTLQENAAAHERKEQEELFKDLLKRQRYEEAIGVARSVIQKYPNSPTATELNKLLPRVDEFRRQAANASQAAIAGAFIQPENHSTQ